MTTPANANDTFVHFMRRCIQPKLNTSGWVGSSPTYYLIHEGNWGMINFQRSNSNTREDFKFTVNLGVVSGRIRRFKEPYRADKRPTVWDSHWHRRLGAFLPEAQEKWWSITANKTTEDLCHELTPLVIGIGVRQVESLITDEALRDLWLTGTWGGTEYQRLERLSILLKAIGPQELLQETLDQLLAEARRFGSGGIAQYHIRSLQEFDPSCAIFSP